MFLAIVTGFWVLFSESWTLVYKVNLLFHPLVGILASIPFVARLLVRRTPETTRDLGLRAVLPALVTTAVFTGASARWPSLMGNVLVLGAWPLFLAIRHRKPLARFLDLVTLHTFTVMAVTGTLFGIALGGRGLEGVLVLHRAAGFVFVPVLAAWAFAVWRASQSEGGADVPAPAPVFAVTRRTWIGVAVLLVLILGLDLVNRPESPMYRFHLSTFAIERRGPDEQDILPKDFNEPDLATRTDSCGDGAGCHPNLVSDLTKSAHGRSMHTAYLQKNVALLAEEIGEHNQITCGGCHYPRMMFDRTKKLSGAFTEINYSCTFCHQIDSVRPWEDPRKSDITVKLDLNHLRMFDQGGRDAIGPVNRRLVELNPFGHARVFRKPLYFEDEYCQACHRLQIKPTKDTPLVKPKCIHCHMQPRDQLGLNSKEMNHIFPGTNSIMPTVLGQPDVVEIFQKFSRGLLPVQLEGWGSFWEPRDLAKNRMLWIVQKAMPMSDPVPGAEFKFRILTINATVDHLFPGGPLDLIEAWQKVKVTDQAGNVLFNVGEIGAGHAIDPLAHRMGGYMMGEDGKPVDRDRVWQIKEKIVTRAIEFHRVTEDDYSFVLPPGVTELRIESYWMYRKLNQEFLDWVYPPGTVTTPPVVTSEMVYFMPLFDPAPPPPPPPPVPPPPAPPPPPQQPPPTVVTPF
jgi:hypothetical protein